MKLWCCLLLLTALWQGRAMAQCTTPITTFPYTESFDAGGVPNCWTPDAGTGYSILWDQTTSDGSNGVSGPQAGAGFMYLDAYNGEDLYNPYTLTTPSFTLPAAAQQLSYYYYLGADGYQGTAGDPSPLVVQISNDGGATWTDIYTHDATNSTFGPDDATSNWHLNAINLAAFVGQTVQFRFYSSSNYGFGYTNQGIDEVSLTAAPSCYPPTAVTASNITATSATLSWTAPAVGTPVGYGWEVVAHNSGAYNGAVDSNLVIGSTTATTSALSPATTYDVYVKSGCSMTNLSDTSIWSLAGTFTTPCLAASLPYSQAFDGTFPACWSTSEAVAGSTVHWTVGAADASHGAAGPYAGAGFAYLDVYNAYDTYNPYYLTSQPVTLGAAAQQLSYYYFLGSSGYTTSPAPLTLEISTDNGATWTALYTHTSTNSTLASSSAVSNWHLNAVSLAAYTNQTVIFRFNANSNYGSGRCNMGVDEFSISTLPTCFPPTGVTASAITSNSATLSWTAPTQGSPAGYGWEVVAHNAGPWATPVASNLVTAPTTTTSTGAVLAANTTYDVYVKTGCSLTNLSDTSTWSAVYSFTTACTAISSLPWTEGFEGMSTVGSTVFPSCWSYVNTYGTNPPGSDNGSISTTYAGPHAGTNFLYSKWNDTAWIYTPGFQLTGGTSYDFSFWMANIDASTPTYFTMDVAYGSSATPGGMTNSLIAGNTASNTAYQQFTRTFTPATSGVYYFGVKSSSPNSTPWYLSFDDFSLQPTPACTTPSALTAGTVTPTGASFSWTASTSNPSSGYNWEVVASGAGSAGTPVASGSVAAGVTTATASGLTTQTGYDIYVQANCGSGTSAWVGPLSVTTPCNAITTLPWTEGFETLPAAAGTNVYPACWTYTNINSSNYSCSATCNSNTAHGGSNFIGGSWSFNTWEYTPGFQLTAGTFYDYSFWYKTADNTNGYVVVSAYGTSASPTAMTNVLGTMTNATSSGAYTKVTYTFQVASTGVYYFGLHDSCPTSAPNGIAFDDFSLQLSPNCIAPTALALTAATATSASVSWSASLSAPANGYIYEAVASGAGPTGTPVVSGTTAAGVTTASISGLSATTAYDIYVRAVCSSTDSSTWLGPLSVTTPCNAITTLPWTEGFETLPAAAGTDIYPSCWTYSNINNTNYTCSATCNSNTANTGSNFMGGSWNFNVWEFTPGFQLTAGTNYDYSFWYRTTDNTNGYVLVSAVGTSASIGGMTTILGTITNAVSPNGYTKVTYTFQATATGVYYFGHHDSCPTYSPNGIAFDDFSLRLSASCLAPSALTLNSANSSGATISWTASLTPPANGYQWTAVPSGSGPSATPAATGTVAAGVTTATITGLNTNAPYVFYVRSLCSATDTSAWTDSLAFLTTCTSVSLPLIEGFNSQSRPTCWTEQSVSGTGVLIYTNTMGNPATAPQEGAGFVEWNSYNTPTTAGVETRLVSPPIVTTGTPSVDISFYWLHDATNYTTGSYLNEGVTVQYSLNGTTWTDVQFYPRVDLNLQPTGSAWFQKLLTLPAAVANQPVVYIGFKFHSEYGNNCAFDNLHLYATPACAGAPTALQVGGVTPTTASVNWTAASPAPAVGYHWIITPTGAGPGAAIDSGDVTGDTANITGLTPNTIYDFYVQSDCGGGSGLGSLAGPITVQTACVNATLPLIEGFNSGSIPSCWSQQYVVGNDDLQYVASSFNPLTTPQEGTDYVFWNGYGISSGNETRLVSPGITTTGTPSVDISFYWFNEHSTYYTAGNYLTEGMTVQYSTDLVNWTDVQFYPREDASLASGTGMWKQKYLTLPAAAGNQATVYVGFKFHSAFGDNVSFDNLHIFQSSPCAGGPTAIGIAPASTTTATANWTAGSPAPASGYNWVVVAAGDSVNGTVIASGTTAAGVTTASISGLTANTAYDFYVQSNCGSPLGVGYWVGPTGFSTPCNAITSIPWIENFEGMNTVGIDIVPSCWLPTPSGRWESEDAPFFFPTLDARSGTHYITDRYNADDTIYTPSFSLTGGTQYEFYFYYRTDGFTGWDSLYALMGTSQSPSGMTQVIGTPVAGPTNTQYMKYSAIFTPATSGDYFFGVKLLASFSPDNIAFDDFGLQEVVPCPNPPLAGVISGPSSVCPGSAAALSLTGYSPYTQLQWQGSLDSVTWQDLVGATNDFYTDYPTNLTYYRVKVNCADSSYTAAFAVNMNAPTLCYCTTNLGGGCGGNDIDTALIQGTNFFINYTTCNTTTGGDAYTVFPAIGDSTTSLQRGGSYTFYLHMTGTSISSIWIDTNQNGVYDTYEWIQPTVAATSGTAVFTINTSTRLGVTGLRIRSRNQGNTNGASSACDNFGSGETFDFQITIVDTNCNHAPVVTPTVTEPTCYGNTNGTLSIALSGGVAPFTHAWSTGDTTTSLSGLAAGVYTDTITFAGGCTYIYNDTLAQPAALAATDSVTPVLCYGAATGSVTVTVSGGTPAYTHHWNTGATGSPLTGVAAGTYVDTISDAHGCTLVLHSDTIRQPASAVAIVLDSTKGTKCNGQSNGAIYTTASGGTGAYSYTWTGTTQTTDDVTGLAAGGYVVVVTDANQCTATLTDSVTQPAPVGIVTDSVVNAKCHSSSDGSIYVHATGGTLPYGYSWSPGGATTSSLFFKPAGAYTLVVTDKNGCTATTTDTIQAPAALTVSSNITNQVQGGVQGSVTVTAAGGTQPYSYHWNTGANTSTISNLNANTYLVTVTDANGCTVTQRDTVDLIIGIKEVGSNITNIYVYPNPSSDVFHVSVKLTHAMPVDLEVYTVTGQQINVAARETTAGDTFVLDMSNEASGVYIVKVKAGDQVVTQRVTLVK